MFSWWLNVQLWCFFAIVVAYVEERYLLYTMLHMSPTLPVILKYIRYQWIEAPIRNYCCIPFVWQCHVSLFCCNCANWWIVFDIDVFVLEMMMFLTYSKLLDVLEHMMLVMIMTCWFFNILEWVASWWTINCVVANKTMSDKVKFSCDSHVVWAPYNH